MVACYGLVQRVVRFSYTVRDDTSGTTGAASVTVVLTQPGQAPCRRLTLPCVSPSGEEGHVNMAVMPCSEVLVAAWLMAGWLPQACCWNLG